MSLTGALSSAISGLNAQSQALAMVSDDLANATTNAYKTNTANFEDLVTNSMNATQYSSGGVQVITSANITQQGLLAPSSQGTNVAIQGQGFFVVSNSLTGGTTSYTRTGTFAPNNQGFLESNGSFLMGEQTDASGNVLTGELVPINTEIAPTNSSPTTASTLALNLPSNAATGATFQSSVSVIDSEGNQNNVEVTWTNQGSNSWTASYGDPTSNATPPVTTGTSVNSDPLLTVTFNSDGSLATTTPNPPVLQINWSNGSAQSNVALNLGSPNGTNGLTQNPSSTTPPGLTLGTGGGSNGTVFGTFSGATIGADGVVEASYSNGQTIAIYKVPVATFADPDALSAQSGGLYTATEASGAATVQLSGQGTAGTVEGGELESSTTNTNEEFATMMQAQQAYSGSAEVVTTVNKMFETLIQSMSA
jgi:flagellar hook protein FlgE